MLTTCAVAMPFSLSSPDTTHSNLLFLQAAGLYWTAYAGESYEPSSCFFGAELSTLMLAPGRSVRNTL